MRCPVSDFRFQEKVHDTKCVIKQIYKLNKPLTDTRNLKANKSETGNILVTSLLILLVMNLLGIGLANLSTKEWSMANYKTIDAEVFHTADAGCTDRVKTFFSTKYSTPTDAEILELSQEPAGTTIENLSQSQTSNSDIAHKLANYSYTCNVTWKATKESTSSHTSGGEIGNSGGSYNSNGNQVIKDYYTVVSTGSGPKSSSKVINKIISVEY